MRNGKNDSNHYKVRQKSQTKKTEVELAKRKTLKKEVRKKTKKTKEKRSCSFARLLSFALEVNGQKTIWPEGYAYAKV